MKKIMFGMIVLLVIPLALAIEEGDVYTQQQIDNFNTDLISPQFLQCQEGNTTINNIWIKKHFSCLELRLADDEEMLYEVVRTYKFIPLLTSEAEECVENNPVEYCQTLYETFLVRNFLGYIETIRVRVHDWQTPYVPPSWMDWLNDIFDGF